MLIPDTVGEIYGQQSAELCPCPQLYTQSQLPDQSSRTDAIQVDFQTGCLLNQTNVIYNDVQTSSEVIVSCVLERVTLRCY